MTALPPPTPDDPRSATARPGDGWARYARQLALPELGVAGQERLAAGRVLLVGCGGLGSPAALWLAGAGVGRLTLVDPDRVEASNLHRQLLYGAADVGRPKVEAARERLLALGAGTTVVGHAVAMDAGNADGLVAGHDVVVDGTDRLPVRYALNDACRRAGVPLVHGSVSRFEGRVTVLCTAAGPCYRCLWPAPAVPERVASCAESGVLGVVPGTVGMLQATEALKLLGGFGEPLVGRLLVVDALRTVTHVFTVARDPLCPVCSRGQIRTTPASRDAGDPSRRLEPSAVSEPRPADENGIPEISPEELAARLRGPTPPVLLDVREPWEHGVARIEGARLVPLNSLPHALSTFDPSREYVVHCHHGVRSLMAAQFLRERGLRQVANLSGGIDAWSTAVDPSVPRY